MSAKLYEPCFRCDGRGKIRGVDQFGASVEVDCPCRGTRFLEIGLTTNQLERLTRKADAFDRIDRLVRPLNLVELGIAADHLASAYQFADADRVRAVQEALAGCHLVIRETPRPEGSRHHMSKPRDAEPEA